MKTIMAPHTPVIVSPSGEGIMKSDRRASKPLMEKRRRERINKSLNELKSILLDALRKDSTCHSKLEKADILEMTVRYLRSIQRQRLSAAMTMDPAMLHKYRAGFVDCKAEVTKFLENSPDNLHRDVKSRLMSHLGPAPYPNLMAANHQAHLMTTAPPMPAGSTFQAIPIQLATNPQMRAMAAAAATLAGEAQNNAFFAQRRFPSPNGPDCNRIPHHGASPSSSPTHHSRHLSGSSTGKRSPDYTSCPSPVVKQRKVMSPQHGHDMRPNVHGSFVVFPNAAQFSSPMQQGLCSPDSRSVSESPCGRYNDSPKSCAPSPMSPSHFEGPSSPKNVQQRPFVTPYMKREPRSAPSPGSENGESVWRPW